MVFTSTSMQEILPILEKELAHHASVTFDVLNPDLYDCYAGNNISIDSVTYLYRSYKNWVDLAELLMCKMQTPKENAYPLVTLCFKKLEKEDSFHLNTLGKKEEKYGVTSHFSQIHKMEESTFFYYYNQALDNVKISNKRRLLNLGINTGDEFNVIRNKLNTKEYVKLDFVGVDHSNSAIAYAKSMFSEDNVTFYAEDINNLDNLKLGQFDLLISIGTLQSPSINFKPFFMKLVQEYLSEDAAIILGFPNSRWIGGEMIYGAKAPNYAMSEMSLVCNDIMFCKKYLQQKKYRVTITGNQYLFITATKIL